MYNAILTSVRVTIVAAEKQNVLNIECVFVGLVIQHAKCIRHIVLSSMACLALQHFCTLSRKRQDFPKKSSLNIKMRD